MGMGLREDDGPTPEYCSFCDPDRPPSDWDRLACVPSTYRKLFIAAKEFLLLQGMKPVLWNKKGVWEVDLDLVNQRTDHPMPAELRRFFLEMGDAFMFTPDDVPDSPLGGWSPIHLDDYAIYNKDFHTQIEWEASEEIASSRPRVDPTLLRAEAERRKLWVPFYGFVGSGDVLCLDAEGKVRFYEASYWRSAPETWDFVLADSFDDFVTKWSGYSFVEPKVCWPTFCTGRSGVFDWSPQHFPSGVERRNPRCGNEKQA